MWTVTKRRLIKYARELINIKNLYIKPQIQKRVKCCRYILRGIESKVVPRVTITTLNWYFCSHDMQIENRTSWSPRCFPWRLLQVTRKKFPVYSPFTVVSKPGESWPLKSSSASSWLSALENTVSSFLLFSPLLSSLFLPSDFLNTI